MWVMLFLALLVASWLKHLVYVRLMFLLCDLITSQNLGHHGVACDAAGNISLLLYVHVLYAELMTRG
jgi:uncharacterized membrane protein YtjA (UPF0391 family)